MKKHLLTILFFLIAYAAGAQIIKGTGVVYFDSIPNVNATTPSGAEFAIGIKAKKAYIWDRDLNQWVELGVDQEQVEDIVGAMAVAGTQSGIQVTYDDAAGTLSFVNEVTNADLDADSITIDPTGMNYVWSSVLYPGIFSIDSALYDLSQDVTLGASGTANTLPIWTAANTLGNSWLSQGSDVLSLASGKGFRLIGGSTAARVAGQSGLLWWNTDVSRLQLFDGVDYDNILTDDQVNSDNYFSLSTGSAWEDGAIYQDPSTGHIGVNGTSLDVDFEIYGTRGVQLPETVPYMFSYNQFDQNFNYAYNPSAVMVWDTASWSEGTALEIGPSYTISEEYSTKGRWMQRIRNPPNYSFTWRDSIKVIGHYVNALPDHNSTTSNFYYATVNQGGSSFRGWYNKGGVVFWDEETYNLKCLRVEGYFGDDKGNARFGFSNGGSFLYAWDADGKVVNGVESGTPITEYGDDKILGIELRPEIDSFYYYWYPTGQPWDTTVIHVAANEGGELFYDVAMLGSTTSRHSQIINMWRFIGTQQITDKADYVNKYHDFSTYTAVDTIILTEKETFGYDAVTSAGTLVLNVDNLVAGDHVMLMIVNADTNTLTLDIEGTTGGFIRPRLNGDLNADATEAFSDAYNSLKLVYDGTDFWVFEN